MKKIFAPILMGLLSNSAAWAGSTLVHSPSWVYFGASGRVSGKVCFRAAFEDGENVSYDKNCVKIDTVGERAEVDFYNMSNSPADTISAFRATFELRGQETPFEGTYDRFWWSCSSGENTNCTQKANLFFKIPKELIPPL